MLFAVLAISGCPPFAGYFSKDQVIYGALEHGYLWMWALGLITAAITAYYMFRLFIVTFFGTFRGDMDPASVGVAEEVAQAGSSVIAHEHSEPHGHDGGHAPAWVMALPVAALGIFSIVAGWIMVGQNSPWARFFESSFPREALPPTTVTEGVTSGIAIVMFLVGLGIAYMRYGTREALADAPARLKRESETLPPVLVNLYYFNEILDWLFVRPAQALGAFFGRWFDPHFVDGVVREVVFANRFVATIVRSFQTGLLRAYALILVFGAACFAVYYALEGAIR
jgi:NADH:ubiquinone oxidoreductase subunit 5 (subunit L)/multisubunit Na+/H+ antiporter MnhA subunit